MPNEVNKPIPCEVTLSPQTLDYLSSHLSKTVRLAVAESMQATVDQKAAEKFWLTGFEMFKVSAATVSGNIILGSFKKLMRQIGFVLLAVLAIYAVGGISGLMAVVKVFFSRLE